MAGYIYCPDEPVFTAYNGYFHCNNPNGYVTTLGNILFENQDVYVPFDFTQLNPAVATDMFTAGFILALAPIATAFGISKLLSLLK